ncbi:MAG: hypothetical protein WD139_10770, partial [Balneolaceae bacterium]
QFERSFDRFLVETESLIFSPRSENFIFRLHSEEKETSELPRMGSLWALNIMCSAFLYLFLSSAKGNVKIPGRSDSVMS